MFKDIKDDDIKKILNCFCAYEKKYLKGEIIISEGEIAEKIGLITRGTIHLIREDYDGNRTIITKLSENDLFAEAFAFAPCKRVLPISVYAETDCSVMFLDYKKITSTCSVSCQCHVKFIENMLSLIAEKNIMLNRRLGHLSKRTTKEKLMSYLSEQAALSGKRSFSIPFNRQQLADYLSLDRSALSKELGKMKKEGLLDYHKNSFVLKDIE